MSNKLYEILEMLPGWEFFTTNSVHPGLGSEWRYKLFVEYNDGEWRISIIDVLWKRICFEDKESVISYLSLVCGL
jgi:hypothetical protein